MMTVMVSKWVGDGFGKEGIYDAMIHLNGYPFLDTKTEYRYSTTARDVMTKFEDLDLVVVGGQNVESLDELIQNTDCKGYPIIENYQNRILVGWAGRAEMKYAIEQARASSTLSPNTSILFTDAPLSSHDDPDSIQPLDLKPWIDQTPTTITPRFPMELIMELFKKMGLRYVLVTQNGGLCGVITKKDLLRHVVSVVHPRHVRRGTGIDRDRDRELRRRSGGG
ncbi:H(+)/Cl(-) exchange transporter 3 [Rhizophlyctis rosea]|uniref:H(+)/Cl(-) exchange transporter 3 n=1 Tax=Rhizophlyctis rosea TaxID=64517 RepID=A0AAD5X3I8_9FUNG|nr:H(+)/Cl(-) exchange transporter 3 [Rhizophlyctis rosea]